MIGVMLASVFLTLLGVLIAKGIVPLVAALLVIGAGVLIVRAGMHRRTLRHPTLDNPAVVSPPARSSITACSDSTAGPVVEVPGALLSWCRSSASRR